MWWYLIYLLTILAAALAYVFWVDCGEEPDDWW